MVSCLAHVLGLRWRKNDDSGRGLRPTEFLSGMTSNKLFCLFFCFSFRKFSFFPFLKP